MSKLEKILDQFCEVEVIRTLNIAFDDLIYLLRVLVLNSGLRQPPFVQQGWRF